MTPIVYSHLTLEPFLNVSNGPEAIAFYKSAFGDSVLFLIAPETGSTIVCFAPLRS